MWNFNMPTDHPRVSFTDVFVPDDALFGEIGRGLSLAQCFVHENRIRQAASSLGAPSIASTKASNTRANESRSARRWPKTRRSSGRWWNWRRRPRCCGC